MRLVLAAALALAAAPAAAQIYKCVDARGVTRYTDQPQPGCKGGEVKIEAQPPVSGTLSVPRRDAGSEERDFQRRRMDEARIREAEAYTRAKQEQQCAQLQGELRRLESGLRVVRPDDKGGLEYMEDQERDRRAAQLRDEIAQKCR